MNINLHIERLILDGLPLTSSQGVLVRAAVEGELTRLLAAGMPGVTGGALPSVQGSDLQLSPQISPKQLGQQIGRAIHAGLNRSVESHSISSRE
ncbi:MAG: hypothetical protein WBW16_14170 [Bacteroidota bacterium]